MDAGPERNNLLLLLPREAKERVFPLLHKIELPLNKVIDAAGEKVRYVYFPVDCLISLVYLTLDGHSTEISVVGHEGISSTAIFMGADSTPNRAVVASAGTAYRMSATDIRREFENDVTVRMPMLGYTHTLVLQMAQTVACNRFHTVDQQLCRWLLLSLDRLPTHELAMTHELIAHMLGVRREGVTEAAGRLQKLGAIQYHRGRITVLDRPLLEALCCECYAVVKVQTDRMVA